METGLPWNPQAHWSLGIHAFFARDLKNPVAARQHGRAAPLLIRTHDRMHVMPRPQRLLICHTNRLVRECLASALTEPDRLEVTTLDDSPPEALAPPAQG